MHHSIVRVNRPNKQASNHTHTIIIITMMMIIIMCFTNLYGRFKIKLSQHPLTSIKHFIVKGV